MSADSLNAAPPPSTATETRSSANGATPKHRAHKGPAVGFEALLAVLTAAQDQTAAAQDAAGKLAAPGLVAPVIKNGKAAVTDAAEPDAAQKDAAGEPAKDAAATAVDATAVAPNAVQDATIVLVAPPAAPLPAEPVATAPVKTASAAETVTSEHTLAAPVAPLAAMDKAVAPPPAAAAPESSELPKDSPADHDPKAYGLAKLESGQTIPAAAAATRRADRVEAKAAPAPVSATPAAATAPAAPAPKSPDSPAATAETPEATKSAATSAAAPALAEAAQSSAPPATQKGAKDTKAPSRYARNEVERSRAAQAAPAGGPATGSAISAKMGDVAQSANNAFALAPASSEDAEKVAPAALAVVAEAPEQAAPSADLNTATSNTTAPATVTHAAAAIVRGEPQTVANLAAQILKKLDGRSTRFDVALDPVGMGHVDVRVEIGAHGRMTAAMAFDTPQAAAELRARAGELKSALEQAGFDVSGGLSFDVAADSGQSQGSAGQGNQPAPVFRGRAFQTALETVVDPAPTRAFQFRRSSASGVDIRI